MYVCMYVYVCTRYVCVHVCMSACLYVCNIRITVPLIVIMCKLLQLTYLPLRWNPQCAVHHFTSSHSDNLLHLPVAAVTINRTVTKPTVRNKAVVGYTVIYGRITFFFWIFLPVSSDANTNHLRHKIGQCSSLAQQVVCCSGVCHIVYSGIQTGLSFSKIMTFRRLALCQLGSIKVRVLYFNQAVHRPFRVSWY